MVTGICDMCGESKVLHLCGDFVICDSCEKQFVLSLEEEE